MIDQIMWYASSDEVNGLIPSTRRHSIKGLYGSEGEEIYHTAYAAIEGCKESVELLASKWGYEFGDFRRPTKIEMVEVE